MLTEEQMYEKAADYLEGLFPAAFHGREQYVIRILTGKEYPTGWEGFVQDSALAEAVS
jgi:hypothetical protein